MPFIDLLDTHVIVLDTNVLLNIYRYSPEFSEFALECLRAVSDNVVLPATVHLEYLRHYRAEFARMEKRFSSIGNETEKQIASAKTRILNSCANLERLQYPDIDGLMSSLGDKMDAVKDILDGYFEDHITLELTQHSWKETDYLYDLVSYIAVMPALTQNEIYQWCEEGEKRCKTQTPPGFKDAKNKDGVRKYSDFIIWKEILRYAKGEGKDIVFVTDDVKADWWEADTHFHHELLDEFSKTGRQIVPMTCMMFFSEVSTAFSVTQSDAVEIALRMTDKDYCVKIADNVFDDISSELIYEAMPTYIEGETAHIGDEGIDEFEITENEFVEARRVDRQNDTVTYEFTYKVTLEGTSYDYWGRDADTNKIILSDGRDHVFEGSIVVEVQRLAESFYDFEDDDSYETAVIIRGSLEETFYQDRPEPPGEYGYCPHCGRPLHLKKDAGGYCIDCKIEYDL